LIAAPGKGILAADESTGTIGSRFSDIKVANTHENRIEYRKLLFTTPNLAQHISGVILFEETLFDKDPATQQLLVKPLVDAGIVLGIKVDQGTKHLPGTDNETYTQVSQQAQPKLFRRCDPSLLDFFLTHLSAFCFVSTSRV
jgi:fructose-bisphosphate aldolase class I